MICHSTHSNDFFVPDFAWKKHTRKQNSSPFSNCQNNNMQKSDQELIGMLTAKLHPRGRQNPKQVLKN